MRVSREANHNCHIGSEVFDFEKKTCHVAGCAKCTTGNFSECIECTDKENTNIESGQCVCKENNEVFSEGGFCISCQVLGCKKCQLDDAGVCEECGSGMIVMEGGCICNDSTLKVNIAG